MDSSEGSSGSCRGEVPLAVDLDGTLFEGDLLLETANAFTLQAPWRIFRLFGWWLQGGRSRLKAQLARKVAFLPESLPYNGPLLAWLAEEKRRGRRLLLVTGSHRLLAEAVARHLGCFDRVFATEEGLNLKGGRKASFLVDQYGHRGFDYIGNEDVDFPVWRAARTAYVVTASPGLLRQVRALGNFGRSFEPGPARTPAGWLAKLIYSTWRFTKTWSE